jgi:signal peptidase I
MASLEPPRRRSRIARLAVALVIFLGLVGGIGLAAGVVLFKAYFTPAGSMMPTLQVGDTFLMSRFAYGLSRYSFAGLARFFPQRLWPSLPRRGDVAVVKLPRDGQTDYVKRVIGLPGERIQLRKGRLYIDDVLVERRPVDPVMVSDWSGNPVAVPAYDELLPGGATHRIIEIEGDAGPLDDTVVFEVPADSYFLLGDNRDNSSDSRQPQAFGLGFVPFENFVGRAAAVVWSASPVVETAPQSASRASPPRLVNWDRLLAPVR